MRRAFRLSSLLVLAVIASAINPQPSVSGAAKFTLYLAKSGDTLMSIALRLYGNMERWKDIAAWNAGVHSATEKVKAGEVLRVVAPPLNGGASPPRCRYLWTPVVAKIDGKRCAADRLSLAQSLDDSAVCLSGIQCEGSDAVTECACESPLRDFPARESFCPTADSCLQHCLKTSNGLVRVGNHMAGICLYERYRGAITGACVSPGQSCPGESDCARDTCLSISAADPRGIDYGVEPITQR